MTLEEAQKLARVVGTADGGCGICVQNLVERLQLAFPQFSWKVGETKIEWRDWDGNIITEDEGDVSEHYTEVLVSDA